VSLLALRERSVFDIGCSYGEHLVHFGPGSVGVTIERKEVEYAQERGIDVRYGNVEEGFVLDAPADVVWANNIFEHLLSPHGFLINLREQVHDDGVLILGVPSIPRFRWLMRFAKFRGALHESHINFFTRDTLRHTVEQAGWRVETVRGYRFKNAFLDRLLDPIYPHFYVVAKKNPAFKYSAGRSRELRGYRNAPTELLT
jgi:SAM-dependent methyltransferase